MKFAIGSRRDDGGALSDRLVEEALLALFRGHAGDGGWIRHAGRVFIPKKFYVAAERNGGELPAGSVAVGEAQQFRAETDRKSHDPHAIPARDQEMAEFVEENHDGEDEQERNELAGDASPERAKAIQHIEIHRISSPRDRPSDQGRVCRPF